MLCSVYIVYMRTTFPKYIHVLLYNESEPENKIIITYNTIYNHV